MAQNHTNWRGKEPDDSELPSTTKVTGRSRIQISGRFGMTSLVHLIAIGRMINLQAQTVTIALFTAVSVAISQHNLSSDDKTAQTK